MAKKREITKFIDIKSRGGAFTAFFRRFGIAAQQHAGIEFREITALRQLLSNEKARMLHIIKTMNPSSIYALAKLLKRDFKSVRKDVELLKHFGLINLIGGKKGKRRLLKPVLNLDVLHIKLEV